MPGQHFVPTIAAMAQTLKNLRIWLGFAGLGVVAMLGMTGKLSAWRSGPVCAEAKGPASPGFAALPAGGAPACLRIRIG